MYSIYEFSKLTGIEKVNLNYYELLGLLRPSYTNINDNKILKIYNDEDLYKANYINKMLLLGFSIDEIINSDFNLTKEMLKEKQKELEGKIKLIKYLKKDIK